MSSRLSMRISPSEKVFWRGRNRRVGSEIRLRSARASGDTGAGLKFIKISWSSISRDLRCWWHWNEDRIHDLHYSLSIYWNDIRYWYCIKSNMKMWLLHFNRRLFINIKVKILTTPTGTIAISPFGKVSSTTTVAVVIEGSGGVVEIRKGDLGGSSLWVLWSGSCSTSSFTGAPAWPPSGVPNCPASE